MNKKEEKKPTDAWTCPLPIDSSSFITLAHGGGGRLTNQLIEKLFRPAFNNPDLETQHDGAVIDMPSGKHAFTTDSYVVQPLLFPGGNIGSLAINGTVNDLAMCGARPLYLTAGFILEENRAIAMGNYFFTDLNGDEAKVEYTFGYKKVDGKLKIDLHHSSFPYNP